MKSRIIPAMLIGCLLATALHAEETRQPIDLWPAVAPGVTADQAK